MAWRARRHVLGRIHSPTAAPTTGSIHDHPVTRSISTATTRSPRGPGSGGKDVVVFAFDHPLGLLAPQNRRVGSATGMPAVQLAARHRSRLAAGDVDVAVDLDARLVAGRSANVVARFGAGPLSETVVVTTPISGWFSCAGERGTGIAVALSLARSVAAHRPVLFLGATGHELDTFGAELLDAEVAEAPRAVVHVGANAACRSEPAAGAPSLSAKRPLRVAGSEDEVAAVEGALGPSGWQVDRPVPATDPARWQGEAATWARRGVTLLSVIDVNPWFHTPEDVAATVTNPEALAQVAEALTAATIAAVTGGPP